MFYKNLIIWGIILNLLGFNVIHSKKNYLRGIDIAKMLENSERRPSTRQSGGKYSCNNKQDEGYYVHKDCRKYWHCLYVGTVFEEALERKCPAGTMFHPIQRICEMSPMLNCLSWYQYIYGKDLVPSYLFTDEDVNSYATSTSKEKIIDTSRELNELLVTFKQLAKISPVFYETEFTDENYETDFESSESTSTTTTTSTLPTSRKTTISTTRTTTFKTTTTTSTESSKFTTVASKISIGTSLKVSTSEEDYYIEQENGSNDSNSANEYVYDDLEKDNYSNYYDDYYYTDYPEPTGSYKIQINTTMAFSSAKNSQESSQVESKFTTLFSSNLLEKLRNFKNEKNQILDEKNISKAKNFTILSSNGKKTFIVQNEASTSRIYKNFSNNQRILTTKKIQPVHIINDIFALNNRSNLEKNYVPNLSSRLFITEKMYAKTASTTTDRIMSYYEDVEAAEAEEVDGEYVDNELMEVEQNFGQDLLLNLQLNIEKTTRPNEYQDYYYSDENAENFQLAEETVSSSAWRSTLNLNIYSLSLTLFFYLLLF